MPKGDREIMKADCEDGYTRIANLILEAIPLAKLTRVQTGICLFLWRRSYGWNREVDAISLMEFAAACGSSRSYVSRQLTDLMNKNIIQRRSFKPGRTPTYAFTTSIALWDKGCIDVQGLHENATQGLYNSSTEGLSSTTTLNQLPAPNSPALEPPLKTERKTIKEINIYSQESIQMELADLLLQKIREQLPNYKQPNLQKWAKTMDDILRLDKRTPEETREVIIFAQEDHFWQANILSANKVREHYDRLNLKRLQRRAGPNQANTNFINQRKGNDHDSDDYASFFK